MAVGWDRDERRTVAATAAVAVPLAVLLYVPVWLSFDRGFGFLDATDGWVSLSNNLARWMLKNYAVAGPAPGGPGSPSPTQAITHQRSS